jgi:hypothetical protein
VDVENQTIRLGKTLTMRGVDAGAEMIAARLQAEGVDPSRRCRRSGGFLSRRGFVVRQPFHLGAAR